MAFSADPAQKYLYLSDFGNSHIAVLDRKALTMLYQFGVRGKEPGNFQGVHHIAVDSKGNLYTADVAPGARAQKFIYKGLSPTLPPNALTPEQLAAKPPARGG
jgi:DNA-binding beta-propeller fold protein YncE